jgi:hypothetical protein
MSQYYIASSGGGGGGTTTFNTQSGSATESGGAITINGANGITTSGSGSTVTITGSIIGYSITTPGSYPYTANPTDGIILVNTSSSANTINLPSSPTNGLPLYIKDNSGNAVTHNITLSPASGNIDGSASYVMNTNYGCATVVYSGTQWLVI